MYKFTPPLCLFLLTGTMKTMQTGYPPSNAPTVLADGLRIERSPAQRGEIAYGNIPAALLTTLTAFAFAGGVISVWIFGYAFWAILEGIARAFGWERGGSLLAPILNWMAQGGLLWGIVEGWRFDVSVLLGIIATWATLYFALDHLALLGNSRAQRILARKEARLLRERNAENPVARSFVEIRSNQRKGEIAPDIGWLSLFPERLLFIGETQIITIPRDIVAGDPRLHHSTSNLIGASLTLPLKTPYPSLRLVARDRANSLSSTTEDTQRLHDTLRGWQHGKD